MVSPPYDVEPYPSKKVVRNPHGYLAWRLCRGEHRSPARQRSISPTPNSLWRPSYGSPYGLGGLSRRDRQGQSVPPCLLLLPMQRSPWGVGRPTFRCVWLRRREAGLVASRTGCRMVISGRTCGDTGSKIFYSFYKGAKPAATQGLLRSREWASPRRKGTPRLFLSPPSFFFTHEKERRGAGVTLARKGRGVLPRIPTQPR